MASIPIPNAVNLQGLLVPRPSRFRKKPPAGEDDMFVAFGVAWATDGGAANCIYVDCQQSGGVQPLSQLCAAYIDNSRSTVDVELVFTDVQTSLFVPAKSQGLYPVVAGATQFYMAAPGAGLGDQTYVTLFNFLPPPVAINETAFASAATNGNNLLTTTALQTSPMMGAGRTGVVTSLTVTLLGATGGASSATGIWSLVDGTGTLITSNFFLRNAATYDDVTIYSQTGLNIPFHNGLNFTSQVTVTAAAAGNIQAIATVR